MWRRLVIGTALGALLATRGLAQHVDPVFDVVSIKPANSVRVPRAVASIVQLQPGRVRAQGITAQGLISLAFPAGDVPRLNSRIAGGPDWLATQQFEFIATTRVDAPKQEVTAQLPALIRAALEDRFKLKGHLEMRPVPIFALVRAKRNGPFGPLLRRSSAATEQWAGSGREYVSATRMTLEQLARQLTSLNAAGRVVVDRTALAGAYDLDLYWSPERTAVAGPVPPEVDGPSLFTAVQEQLGLRLDPRTEPQDVYVVDSIERPEPN